LKWEEGKIIEFRGCVWNDGWEFDAPLIIYSPVERFFDSHWISQAAIERKVEDICIDLCIDGEIRDRFSKSDLKEFTWRGWSVPGFRRRKSAVHGTVKVKLVYDEHGERSCVFLES